MDLKKKQRDLTGMIEMNGRKAVFGTLQCRCGKDDAEKIIGSMEALRNPDTNHVHGQ